jgi:hypothetical protein
MSKKEETAYKADVVVLGGGTAGVPAAIAAARNGVSCLLIERYGFLGGTATIILVMAGFSDRNGNLVIGGIPNELIEEMVRLNGSTGHVPDPVSESCTCVDPEILKYIAMEMTLKAGVRPILHSFFYESDIKSNSIDTLSIINKSGIQNVKGRIFVDCSGDADLAASAGAPFNKDENLQPVTMTFRMGGFDKPNFMIYLEEHPEELEWAPTWTDGFTLEYFKTHENFRFFKGLDKLVARVKEKTGYEFPRDRIHFIFLPREGEVQLNTTRVRGIDSTDARSLTQAEIAGRRQVMEEMRFLVDNVPGFEHAYLIDTSVQIGLRESRRIDGDYTLTKEDTLSGRQFEDSIGKGVYPVDIHDPTGRGMSIYRVEKPYTLPYSMLVPKKIDNLLVAGRCASMTHEGLASPRTMPTCMVMGQAAGTAAALCVKNNAIPREVDIKELQRTLRQQGAIL